MLSIIIPAELEQSSLNRCLTSLIASDSTFCPIEIIVVACENIGEETVAFEKKAAARGWRLQVLKIDKYDRIGALNAGDSAAKWPWRAYISDSVAVSPKLLDQLCRALDGPKARYVFGSVGFKTRGLISRTYVKTYQQISDILPFMQGRELYAVNAAGRARWGQFPDAVSDELYVKLLFNCNEVTILNDPVSSASVKGPHSLAQTKLQHETEIRTIINNCPDFIKDNRSKLTLSLSEMITVGINNPRGFLLYLGLDFVAKLRVSSR